MKMEGLCRSLVLIPAQLLLKLLLTVHFITSHQSFLAMKSVIKDHLFCEGLLEVWLEQKE